MRVRSRSVIRCCCVFTLSFVLAPGFRSFSVFVLYSFFFLLLLRAFSVLLSLPPLSPALSVCLPVSFVVCLSIVSGVCALFVSCVVCDLTFAFSTNCEQKKSNQTTNRETTAHAITHSLPPLSFFRSLFFSPPPKPQNREHKRKKRKKNRHKNTKTIQRIRIDTNKNLRS